jgi:ABC-type polysaccharide/polyol phosphate transport system ATPase subunit
MAASPSVADSAVTATPPGPGGSPSDGPVVIEVRDVAKKFLIPEHRVDSLKERATHPFAHRAVRELHALRGVSFDVHDGEFFGIVGRNGSGKSTLLKILSSIYRPDSGTVRMAGRLAPFIELGVGFNPELASRDNIVLNGVLMGLSRREAQRRIDSVLDFADLREFADLKLKNYSSGMQVRLAFAVMVEADADIMLIDEVLAVGDAAFAQKCMDEFRAKRASGKTVVLVTHDMPTVQEFCDRAMLISDGVIQALGDPEEVALQYYRLNFADTPDPEGKHTSPNAQAELVDAWLEDAEGNRVDNVEQGEPIRFHALVEAKEDLARPLFVLVFVNAEGVEVFGLNLTLGADVPPELDRVPAGQRARVSAEIENPLLPGRYYVNGAFNRNGTPGDLALMVARLLQFVVFGTEPAPGTVSIEAETRLAVEPGPAA